MMHTITLARAVEQFRRSLAAVLMFVLVVSSFPAIVVAEEDAAPADAPAATEVDSSVDDTPAAEADATETDAPATESEAQEPVVEDSVAPIDAPELPEAAPSEEGADDAVPAELQEDPISELADTITEDLIDPILVSEDEGSSTVIEQVELGITYSHEGNDQVQVTFTQLPETPGSLTITEVTLSDEQIEALGAVSRTAYDITSSMENGTFAYDLKLPVPAGLEAVSQVVYAQSVEELEEGASAVASEKIEMAASEDAVVVTELDHFTVFVVTSFEEVQVTPPTTSYNGIWIAWGTNASVTQVPTGTGGIASSEGGNHAIVEAGAYTAWDGYKSTFPSGGYDTRVDVYLDMDLATGAGFDKRMDFSSAVSNTSGNHRRDFIFHLGTDPTTAGQWLVSASNNSVGWPGNPANNPEELTESGWYTLEHQFRSNAGTLEVTFNIYKKADNSLVGSWTRSDASDVIGSTVGGNRYGWFIDTGSYAFDQIIIDNAQIEYSSIPHNEQTVVVRAADLQGWYEAITVGGVVDFLDEPTAPLGDGALNLTTQADNQDRAALMRDEDVALADITELSYRTKRGTGFINEGNAAYRVRIDADGNPATVTDVATLIYEPYWQNATSPDAAPIVQGVWQTWDVDGGFFWASIPGGNAVSGLTNGSGGPPFYTIDDVLTLHPNARVTAVSVGVGSYNNNYDILIDAFVFGYRTGSSFETVTYDFEPTAPDTTPPMVPVHLSPLDNAVQNFNDFYFDWTDVADAVEYEFQSSQNPAVGVDGALTTGVWNNKAHGAPDRDFLSDSTIHSYGANGTWYWQVRARDAAGNWSAWTTPWKLTIDLTPPSPADSTRPTLVFIDPAAANQTYDLSIPVTVEARDTGSGLNGLVVHFKGTDGSTHLGACGAGLSGLAGTTASTTYSCTLDVSSYPDGTYYLRAGTTDIAGNNRTVQLAVVVSHRDSEILQPTPSEATFATTELEAFYADENGDGNDAVQWAVRAGTCAASTNTVFGNVDGKNTPFSWNGTNFLASIDTTTVADGEYCFVFNPTEDTGDANQRLTRTFNIDNTGPTAPAIVFPAAEQIFTATPILNDWTEAADPNGVVTYEVAYAYDDGHTFGGSTCPTVSVIDTVAISGCRQTSATERNHTPAIDEQGGVTIWVRAFDALGNAGEWSDPVHYWYDVTGTGPVSPPTAPTNLSSGGGGGSYTHNIHANDDDGEVLGATTDACIPLIGTYLSITRPNDSADVTDLQNFLNGHMNAGLAVTGIFTTATEAAVHAFQKLYWQDVLAPWFTVPGSGITDADDSTGVVFLTTKWKINDIVCPGGEAKPVLQ